MVVGGRCLCRHTNKAQKDNDSEGLAWKMLYSWLLEVRVETKRGFHRQKISVRPTGIFQL